MDNNNSITEYDLVNSKMDILNEMYDSIKAMPKALHKERLKICNSLFLDLVDMLPEPHPDPEKCDCSRCFQYMMYQVKEFVLKNGRLPKN